MIDSNDTDYDRLLKALDPEFVEQASHLLTNDAYATLSPEAKVGFLKGFEAAVSMWQKIPKDYLAMSFAAVLGVVGTNVHSDTLKRLNHD